MMTTCVEGGTFRWMSPELLDPEDFGLTKSRPTKESDCYALGMVVYEVLSGQVPFASNTSPVVIRNVLKGRRPARPHGEVGRQFTGAIWGVLELCWKRQPSERTSVEAVFQALGGNTSPVRLVSDADENAEMGCDYQSDVTANDSRMFLYFTPGSLQLSLPYIGPPVPHSESDKGVADEPFTTVEPSALLHQQTRQGPSNLRGLRQNAPKSKLGNLPTRLSGWFSNTFNTASSSLTLPMVISKRTRISGPKTLLVNSPGGKGGNSLPTVADQTRNISRVSPPDHTLEASYTREVTDRPNNPSMNRHTQRFQSGGPLSRNSLGC